MSKPGIIALNIGMPKTIAYMGKDIKTGIYKQPTNELIFLSKLGFAGDGQADLDYHGGIDKAVCLHSYEHYPYWEKELNRKLELGAFGENLTVIGMTEEEVNLGDIYQLGGAIVQVSQPRQPCYKIAVKFNVKDLTLRVQNTGLTGYYMRVLQEGLVTRTSEITLLERNSKGVTLAYANNIMHHDKENYEGIKRILDVKELSASWRSTLTKRLKGEEIDTTERLTGER